MEDATIKKRMEPLTIVVLNWNTSNLLNDALGSIVDTASDIPFQTTVIDNASTDGGFALVDARFKNDTRFSFIQNEKNIGWAAINAVLARTKGTYLVTVDPDAVLKPNALQALLRFMEANPKVGAATAKLLNPDGTPQLYYRKIMTLSRYFFTTLIGRAIDKYLLGLSRWRSYRYERIDLSKPTEVEQPAWPCLMWRKEVFTTYIVDEKIPFYFLDVDMSHRVYDRGYSIYVVPEATVIHLKSTSYGKAKNDWREREYNRSLKYYFKKHYALLLPFFLILFYTDRVIRKVVFRLTGREPLR